jgi:hypothetical protein
VLVHVRLLSVGPRKSQGAPGGPISKPQSRSARHDRCHIFVIIIDGVKRKVNPKVKIREDLRRAPDRLRSTICGRLTDRAAAESLRLGDVGGPLLRETIGSVIGSLGQEPAPGYAG